MFFYLVENNYRNPYYNLAREEALAITMKDYHIKAGLRFWRNPSTIVLGISDSLSRNVDDKIFQSWKKSFSEKQVKKNHFLDSVYIVRRASGGGTVFQSFDGNLNFSFFVDRDLKPELDSVTSSYKIFLGFVQAALKNQKIFIELKGHSDLSFLENNNFLKVSGNSQFRKKNTIVHHGTLILDKKLIEEIESLLLHPPKEPEYRQKRKHSEFLKSLPLEFEVKKFQDDLKKIFLDYLQISQTPIPKAFWRQTALKTKELQITKYQSLDFIESKT